MKILLVDDSRTMRNIQKNVLKVLEGVSFIEAGDGVEALTAVTSEATGFDLMLVDWNMPNMDGLTFVRSVRGSDKDTPIIMVTTESEEGRKQQGRAAGATGWIVKPFRAEQLVAVAKRFLK